MNEFFNVLKQNLWGFVVGTFAGMALMSYGFGYMSPTDAKKLATASTEKAVVVALAPVCAEKFSALPDVAARTATLVANRNSTYAMRDAFPKELIITPGSSYPDSGLVEACANLIFAKQKSAAVK